MPRDSTDEDIVRKALADKEAFALLVERYAPKLDRYLERLGVHLREDRQDVLQNAFVKAYRNLNGFDQDLSFSSWMYRIAHNETMSFFRAKRARPSVTLDEDHENILRELKDDLADTSASAEKRISREELAKALSTLPAKYRDVLTLRYFEERSYSDMSDILALPVGTVSTLIHRAKQALKDALPASFMP